MKKIIAAVALSVALAGSALAQTAPLDGDSLTWLVGSRAHTSVNGSKIYEAFIGPVNGVVTGTANFAGGVEYHKLGPGPDGKTYGLSVANTRGNMVWNFTPLKAFEKDRVIFQSTDGATTIQYFAKPGNGVGALVERKAASGQTTRTEYDFKPVP